jgi:Tol biopolymer transport system component
MVVSRTVPLWASLAAAMLLALGVVAVGATLEPAQAAFPGANGKIAFTRLDNEVGKFYIFVVEPDGTGLRKLAAKPANDNDPAWSPNGKRLAFEASESLNTFNLDIYIMNADGSGVKRITKQSTHDRMPSWSPDGTKIAFMKDRRSVQERDTGDIYTIRVDGTHLRQLTDNGLDEYPAWSPDGKTVAFDRPTKAKGRIYTVNSDGGGLRTLTDPPQGLWDSQPSWSPDGTRIAFTRASESRADVFTMNSDGTHTRKLTGKTDGFSPAFSPDGKKIAFVSNDSQTTHIYVMKADGTDVRRLTTKSKVNDDAPDWQTLP